MTKKTQLLNAFLATLTALALTLMALPARAAGQNCGPRSDVVERLSTRFGETRRGIGLGTGNRILEVFASDDSGTWTVTVTLPDGRMCMIASGQAWEDRMDDLAHLADADA
ncbi:MAG: hypothetical protein AAF366_16840 [Pseudomonadota bacterium]